MVDAHDDHRGFLIDWIKEFAKRYEEVAVITVGKGIFELPSNVRVYSLGKEAGVSKIVQAIRFYWYLTQLAPQADSIFAHASPIFVIAGYAVSGFLGKPIYLWYAHKSITFKLRVAEFLADGIFTSTPEGFRLPSQKVFCVGQGIDMKRFSPGDSPARLDSIIAVGRLSSVKQHEIIIRTVAELKNMGREFTLTIIGASTLPSDVSYERHLKELVKELNLEALVSFLGKISNADLPAHYRAHQFYINVGKTGSLDKTIIEAMACGCIPLSSNDSARKILPAELVILNENPESIARQILNVQAHSIPESLVEYAVKHHSLAGLAEKIKGIMVGIIPEPRVIIAGYAYIRENYFRTFDFFPSGSQLAFILPRKWPIKKGKAVYYPPHRGNVYPTATFFHHSDYSIIGGLLKGWMPLIPFKLFRLKEFDVFYNCNEPTLLSTLYNTLWAKLFGMKVVLFSWENVSFDKKFKGFSGYVHRLILNTNLTCATGIICGNEKCREIFKRLTDKPLAVIPLSGVDTEFFKPSSGLVKDSGQAYLFAGSISYRKGIETMLAAFKKVLAEIPEARLQIVGSGEYESVMLERIKVLGLEESSTVYSWVDHNKLLELFQSADVFLYPSIAYKGWEEQFGYSMAEASLCGLPIIATRSGSISELVEDGKTGIIVEEKNSDELASAMIRLGASPALRFSMGQAGRHYIAEKFSYQAVSGKFYAFFKQIYG